MTVRRHMKALIAFVVVWGASIAAFAAARGNPAAEVWASHLSAVAVLLAIGATVLFALRRGPWPLRQRPDRALAFASVPVVLLIALSGGFESPAALLPAFFVLSIAGRHGLRIGYAAAACAAGALILAEFLSGSPIDLTRAVPVLALTASVGVIPFWFARRADVQVVTAKQRMARVEGYLAQRRLTPSGSDAVAADLRFESQVAQQDAEGMHDLEELDRYLRDVRDASGADEVIFWRWDAVRSTQMPAAWSTEGTTSPRYFAYEQWAPLVKWAAEGEMTQCVDSGDIAWFIAGPVRSRSQLHGVLTLSSRAGLTLSPDGARAWIARYAAQVALLVDLLDVRRHYGRNSKRTKALLEAAEQFQAHASTGTLAKAICRAALEVTSAKRAALVEWDAREQRGILQATAGNMNLPERMAVVSNSFVGERCVQGLPVTKADARSLAAANPRMAASDPMMNPTEGSRTIGSLSVIPLKIDGVVIGAMLIEGDKPDEITAADGSTLALLGKLAANFLEVAWRIERADVHARTDQLTGLWNRRHFDEQQARVLAEADRSELTASLILADVDFFKKVNDTYGHDAGDKVLKMVAETFTKEKRGIDICARIGGEEIAILSPNTTAEGARLLAERLREALEKRSVYHVGRQIHVTASFGVASYPEAVATKEGLHSAADRALYRAKADGRNRVRVVELSHGRKQT